MRTQQQVVVVCWLLEQSPKSGDITRCVNVVDSLEFPQEVCMDNQKHLVDKTINNDANKSMQDV